MSKRFAIILALCVVVFGGILIFTKRQADAPTENGGTSEQASNHTIGAGTSGVTLVEYGDFQCPACGSYYPIVKQVKEHFGDQITFQFRNFPLVQIHKNAMAGSRAAEAASLQGKFWEMHDLLYETQTSWQSATNASTIFESYATQLGLDIEKFKQDTSSSAVNDAINADVKAAQAIGASSTPTFVLDGKKLDKNPGSLEEFIKVIEDAIKAKTGQ